MPEWHAPVTKQPSHWHAFAERTMKIDRLSDIALITAATAALVAVDDKIAEPFFSGYTNSPLFRDGANFWVEWGDGKYNLGLAGAMAAYGFIAGDKRSVKTGCEIAEAILASGIVVQVIKHISGRESPAATSSPTGVWRVFPNPVDYHRNEPKYYAFPSGHTATVVAALTVLNENYPDAAWLRYSSYAIVGLVGAGLVAKKMHWFSDFPLAVAIGYSFGTIAASQHETKDSHAVSVSYFPVVMDGGAGVAVQVAF